MARPSDREFALKRKIKDLEEKVLQLEIENKKLKKSLTTTQEPKKIKKVEKKPECPQCGGLVKESALPFGTLILCQSGCGHREIKK
jgi:regulator of replication initiation timing